VFITRSQGKRPFLCCGRPGESAARSVTRSGNEYSATYHVGSSGPDDNTYTDIRSDKQENIYNEIDTLLEDPSAPSVTSAGLPEVGGSSGDGGGEGQYERQLKLPVTMKRSYSHPDDMLRVSQEPRDTDCKDNYTFPYDQVYKPTDTQSVKRPNIATKLVEENETDMPLLQPSEDGVCSENGHEGNKTDDVILRNADKLVNDQETDRHTPCRNSAS